MAANGGMSARRRKMFALWSELELSHEDLIDFAEVILWRDVESTKDLDENDVGRLLDAISGYEKITHLRRG